MKVAYVAGLDGLPVFPANDCADNVLCNSILLSENRLLDSAGVLAAHLSHLFGSKDGSMDFFAPHNLFGITMRPVIVAGAMYIRALQIIAPLLTHIAVVVCNSADKKMFGIYAQRSIAMMQNAHSLWYWALRKFPRYTVCSLQFPGCFYLPIAFAICACCPEPAFVACRDFCPKTLLEVSRVRTNTHKRSLPHLRGRRL